MNLVCRGIVALILATAVTGQASATDSGTMMCSGGIVSLGDTMGQVTNKCGQPAFSSQRESRKTDRAYGGITRITTTIDDWQYNFGPNQFQYRIVFEGGRVSKIESLDYGY
jgi:hypothetical protein